MPILAIAAALALPALPPINRDFLVEGRCPAANSEYRGRLSMRSAGLFLQLTWTFADGGAVVGTGMPTGARMVVAFHQAGGRSGLMEMATEDGRVWRGSWAFFDSREYCSETWTAA